jgi:DNA replication protein DnaC
MQVTEEIIGLIEYYSRAMKAPRIREGSWSHEEYLAAVRSREVAAREASGAEIRARAAGFPARKSLEDFNFDHQPSLKRDIIAHLATGAFLTEVSTSSSSDRPAPAKPASPLAWS